MSRLWPERLCIALLPDRLAWVVLARGKRIRAQGSFPVPVVPGGSLWQPAIEELQRILPTIPMTNGKVSVVLSNAFVRYMVIDSSLTSDEERLALARHDFQKIHGILTEGWEIRIAAGEQNYLAAAVDSELPAQLRHCFASTRLKLQTIQPYAVAAFNHWAKCFVSKKAEALFLAEPYGYCYAGMSNGQWEFLYCGRFEGTQLETCQHVVQREALRTGVEGRCVWSVFPLEAATTQDHVNQPGVKKLPLDDILREARQVDYFMALLGAM